MWMGELITQRGIGNGISLMIFASIVSRPPERHLRPGGTTPTRSSVVMMPFIALAVIVGDRLRPGGPAPDPGPVREARGRPPDDHAAAQTYLPLRVNMAGVIPVIFAASIMAFPPTVGQLINTPAALDFAAFFSPNGWAYVVGEIFFIIIFTYFYTAVTFNPVDQADNLKKYGGFIPGVQTRATDGRIPGPDPLPAHLPRRALPGRGRGAADDPDQPDVAPTSSSAAPRS